ncbi:thiol-disulfide oxidoreductase DCC family protein [Solicola sp. PLA-1-18]|uniref:thiol-disulfide oxidoreductase DCC family protein n=1 Tax=Solicola sp. PLA-1-18 TaxID=3380532 RepID=UPI003B7B9764
MATPTFLFDGDCSFCTSSVRVLERWVPHDAHVVPWQHADLDALGVTQDRVEAAVVWVDGGRRTDGPLAIADVMRTSRPWWRLAGAVLGRPPVLWLAWPVYRWVARNRGRLPGGTPACGLPPT